MSLCLEKQSAEGVQRGWQSFVGVWCSMEQSPERTSLWEEQLKGPGVGGGSETRGVGFGGGSCGAGVCGLILGVLERPGGLGHTVTSSDQGRKITEAAGWGWAWAQCAGSRFSGRDGLSGKHT